MYRLMTRLLIVLGLVLTTSMPGFARMAPMAIEHTGPAICAGHGCANHHAGDSSKHHMTAVCLTMACAGPVSLPAYAVTVTPLLHGAAPYEPPVSSLRAGLRPMPDGPPPRSFSLS